MSDPANKRASERVSYPCEVECSGVGIGLSPLNPRISDVSATGAASAFGGASVVAADPPGS